MKSNQSLLGLSIHSLLWEISLKGRNWQHTQWLKLETNELFITQVKQLKGKSFPSTFSFENIE